MATNITSPDASAITRKSVVRRRQFQGVFDVIEAVVTFDENSVAAQIASVGTFTIPGAALGDIVLPGFGANLAGMIPYGWVSAADTVKIGVFNVEGTDAVTALSANPSVNVLILKPSSGFGR